MQALNIDDGDIVGLSSGHAKLDHEVPPIKSLPQHYAVEDE